MREQGFVSSSVDSSSNMLSRWMGGLEEMLTASNYLYGQEECRLSVVGKFFAVVILQEKILRIREDEIHLDWCIWEEFSERFFLMVETDFLKMLWGFLGGIGL